MLTEDVAVSGRKPVINVFISIPIASKKKITEMITSTMLACRSFLMSPFETDMTRFLKFIGLAIVVEHKDKKAVRVITQWRIRIPMKDPRTTAISAVYDFVNHRSKR